MNWQYLIYGIFYLIASILAAIRYFHYLQLNSYKNQTQLRWMGTHRERLACLLPCLLCIFFAPAGAVWSQILCIVLLIFSCYTIFPRKAKKPLVYTGRIKRLIATYSLIILLFGLIGYFLPSHLQFLLPALVLFSSPFICILANILNSPFEKAVRQWYIRDALKKLKSSPNLIVVGVTGSYGKTSVKSYLGQLLSTSYDTLITPESFNTPMGIVRTIREHMTPTNEIFVCEMGARHVGDIKELCDMVSPQYGIITAVGNQHLETFHSQENITNTKFELADALPKNGILFVNGDNELIRKKCASLSQPIITYGLNSDNDYYASDISVSITGTSFTLHTPGETSVSFRMKLIGTSCVQNVVGALAFCLNLGIPEEDLVPAVRKLNPVPHRMQLLPGNPITYIDDAYNSNPAGCKSALKTLSLFDACKILVTPGMVELGKDMESSNKQFGLQAADVADYVFLVGERQAVPIREGLLEAGFPSARISVCHTLNDALNGVRAISSAKQKVVLLENDLPDNY